jgi:DNA-binding response OmpR family regulator
MAPFHWVRVSSLKGRGGLAEDNVMMRAAQTRAVLSLGPFSLVVSERLLTRDGVPVAVSGRTLDILIALLSRPNEVIDKKDLLARVWPDVRVEEGNLRFHMIDRRRSSRIRSLAASSSFLA